MYEKKNAVEVKDSCENLKISANGITVFWNWGDNLKVELDEQYKKKVCGMCGNYDGSAMNDIQWEGLNISTAVFGNLHKASDLTGDCPDVVDNSQEPGAQEVNNKCKNKRDECENIMSQMGDCKYRMKSYQAYLEMCTEDLCNCAEKNQTICLCSNLNQFSKACVEVKGHPGMWRHTDFCYISCPKTMEFSECASPCPNTCTNPMASRLCTEKCKEGCSCPPGTVLDDVNNNKMCVKKKLCPCAHNGKIYKSGESYSAACQKCTCILGHWICNQVACSGNCTIKGGAHVQTFDEREYSFHGNCQYVISTDTEGRFTIVGNIVHCGMRPTETCLNTVFIYLENMTIKICYCGNVYINNFIVHLPKIKDKVAIYKRSAFYVYVETPFGLSVKVQVKPVFQLFISVNSTFQNKTSGLCGNFDGMQADDLMTLSGVVEDAVSAFCNSYKVKASCSDVPDYYDDPCSTNIIKEEYAKHWCSRLVDPKDVFAPCHDELDPKPYHRNCVYDVCNLENSEETMCAWLGVYADECRSRNVILENWRDNNCALDCPETMVFTSNPRQCNFTCNSLAELDVLCHFRADPSEGCSCPEGTYLTFNDKCVPPEDCPCNYKGRTVPAHQTFEIDEIMCKCIRGILECPKVTEISHACKPPMYYYNCSSPGPDTMGSQCQKSCKTQDMKCYSDECVPGCVCPKGLVSDDNGGCIPPSECPCVYGGKFHVTGSEIKISCNTCTCKERTWECTQEHCPKTCKLYGNGNIISFDQSWKTFSGTCDYILAQDFCPNNKKNGTFKIEIQHFICGNTNAVCSMKIKISLLNTTIEISEKRVEETSKTGHKDYSYNIILMAQHIVFMMEDMILMYDQKVTVTLQVSNATEGAVCGLCGDNDGKGGNDFTSPWSQGCIQEGSRSSESACSNSPTKLAWAQKHCSIIKGEVFSSCHLSVDPIPFFDTCVADTCSCNNDIGDCECLCTSVAAYSAACRRHDICIKWRTPKICPLFCDYFNKEGHCDWHYNPCGAPCMKTCLNPAGECETMPEKLEGCYPQCSAERPYFDVESQMCVQILNCSVCKDRLCDEQTKECLCCYYGKTYRDGQPLIEIINGQLCVSGYCLQGNIMEFETICKPLTSATTALTVTPKLLTPSLPKQTTTVVSEITKKDLSKYTYSTLRYTNASTTIEKYSSTKFFPVSSLIPKSSRSVTKTETAFRSRTLIKSKSTPRMSPTYSREFATMKTMIRMTRTSPYRTYANYFKTSKTSKLHTSTQTTSFPLPTTTSTPSPPHTIPTLTTTPRLYYDTRKTTTPFQTHDYVTSKTTKLRTSTLSTTPTVPSKTTTHTPTFPFPTSTSTLSPPYTITTPITTPRIYYDTRKTTTPFQTHDYVTSKTTNLRTSTSSTTPTVTTFPLLTTTPTLYPPYTRKPTTSPRTFAEYFKTSKTTMLHTSIQPSTQIVPSKSTTLSAKSTTTKPSTRELSMISTKMGTTGGKSTLQPTEGTRTRPITDCLLMSQLMNITKGDCRTLDPVSMNYCSGRCATSSLYSLVSERMTRKCSCCMDTERSSRSVELTCLDGSTKPYTYDHVDKCSCVAITCYKEN
ncbi:mucin-5B-like [Engystomops pustulosus]|uniref:mucin-5B-like n=1 Tax=Engystomops pustulosus TaxID=76066 RepID=UPI003AFB454D